MAAHGRGGRAGAASTGARPARFQAGDQLQLVRTVAAGLLVRTDEIAAGMTQVLHGRVPELRADPGPQLLQETRVMCVANVGQALRLLAAGEPVSALSVPPEAIEYTRSYVHRGIPLVALLRVYHLGHQYFLEECTHALTEGTRGSVELGASVRAVSSWMSAYVDRVCERLIAEYRSAAEKWSRSVAAVRADTVRGILAGTIQDELEAAQRLDYELRREHVGLVVWRLRGFPPDSAALSRAAMAACHALNVAEPLVVPAGAAEVWVWCPRLSLSPTEIEETLATLNIDEGVGLAIGRRASGTAGFRRTHVDAVAAARVAAFAGARASAVTSYHAVELVALLTADIDSARIFVRNELGGLAAPGRQVERLRETVLAFLQEGMSNRGAGRRLFCHQNTVAYRMMRARELLGRPLEVRRTELVAALLLATHLGATVLARGDAAA